MESDSELYQLARSMLNGQVGFLTRFPGAANSLSTQVIPLEYSSGSDFIDYDLFGISRHDDEGEFLKEGGKAFFREQAHIISSQIRVVDEIKASLSEIGDEVDSVMTAVSFQAHEIERLQLQIASIESSVRYKLGAELLAAMKNPMRWLRLPRSIFQVYREWKYSSGSAGGMVVPQGHAEKVLAKISEDLNSLYKKADSTVSVSSIGEGATSDSMDCWWVKDDARLPLRQPIESGGQSYVAFGSGSPIFFRLKTYGASSLLVRLRFKHVSRAVHIRCKGFASIESSDIRGGDEFVFSKVISHENNLERDGLLVRLPVPLACDFFDVAINSAEDSVLYNHVDFQPIFPGVSVVMPSYMGEDKIQGALDSLARQTLDHSKIELVVVANGPQDSTLDRVQAFSEINSNITVKAVYTEKAGAGSARNLGLRLAGREYVVFLDDDDSISDNYLNEMYGLSGNGRIVFTHIMDLIEGRLHPSSISEAVYEAARSGYVDAQNLAGVATMSACKMIPTCLVKQVSFDPDLRSGEDVHYFVVLLSMFNPGLIVVPSWKGAFYIRTVTGSSVSRQGDSRDFSIDQRLAVIAATKRDAVVDSRGDIFRMYLNSMRSQIQFCMRYLERNPDEWPYYNQRVQDLKLAGMDCVRWANERMARDLVFSYCFPPFIDTAGIVMAKRINEAGRPVNVISNDMSEVRAKDERLLEIVASNIGRLDIVDCQPSFCYWPLISRYVGEAVDIAEMQVKGRGVGYERIYSRAMWPGSHFAAAKYKSCHPEVRWIAEFSDPILIDINAEMRVADMDFSWIEGLGINDLGLYSTADGRINSNMYYWCEMLPYLMADEVVFTNENQMEYMLSFVDVPSVIDRVRSIASIRPHPTLPPNYYELSDAEVDVDCGMTSFAYFGSFYESRGVQDILVALKGLSEDDRKRVAFHIYTAQEAALTSDPVYVEVQDCVKLHPLVGYLDFLKLSGGYDYLVVCDAQTLGKKKCNPYLPSKVSDYMGNSKGKIWAVVEDGSPLHMLAARMPEKISATLLGDVAGNAEFMTAALLQTSRRLH